MNATHKLRDLGQSLWLDNITRDLLDSGTLAAIHRRAVGHRPDVESDDLRSGDQGQRRLRQRPFAREVRQSQSGEDALLRARASTTSREPPTCSGRPSTGRTASTGSVSLEVSPLLAHDTATTLAAAKDLHARAGRPNLFIKIPGTPEGLPAIEEAIFAGIPINVTLLFSREQYLAAARSVPARDRAAHRGRPRPGRGLGRLAVRQPLGRRGAGQGAAGPARPLGIAIAQRAYKAYCELNASARAAAPVERGRHVRSVSCSRAPAPRTRRLRTCSTSKRWPRPSRSTRCPRPR